MKEFKLSFYSNISIHEMGTVVGYFQMQRDSLKLQMQVESFIIYLILCFLQQATKCEMIWKEKLMIRFMQWRYQCTPTQYKNKHSWISYDVVDDLYSYSYFCEVTCIINH